MCGTLVAAGTGIAIAIPIAFQRDGVAHMAFQDFVVSHQQVYGSICPNEPIGTRSALQTSGTFG